MLSSILDFVDPFYRALFAIPTGVVWLIGMGGSMMIMSQIISIAGTPTTPAPSLLQRTCGRLCMGASFFIPPLYMVWSMGVELCTGKAPPQIMWALMPFVAGGGFIFGLLHYKGGAVRVVTASRIGKSPAP